MGKHHRIMELLPVAIFLSACILSASGKGLKKSSVDVKNIFNNFNDLLMVESSVPTDAHHVGVRSISLTISPNCTEISELDKEFLELRNQLGEMIVTPILSHRYRIFKENFETKISQIKSLMNTCKAKESGKRLNMLVTLQDDFETQRKLIYESLTTLEAEEKRLNEAKVQIVMDRLEQGNYEEAANAMGTVTDHENHIERVLESVYGNGENFERICRFIGRLPLHSQLNGYKFLHEQLKKDNKMRDQYMWALAVEINRMQARDRGELEAVMVDFKTMIRKNNMDGLIAALNREGSVESMTDFVPFLVRTIYEETDSSGIEKFITVLNEIQVVHHKLYLINEFILMLKSSGGMHGRDVSMIIFELMKLRADERPQNIWAWIKAWIQVFARKQHAERKKNLIQVIEQNLPAELRDLMYDHLCIRNGLNHEYLFVGTPIDEDHSHVYTATAGVQPTDSASWRVQFIDNGKKILIRNSKYGESSCLTDERSHDGEHGLPISMTNKQEGDKTVEFYLDMLGDGEFLIVNEYSGQALYSPFNSVPSRGDKRPVFSRKFDRNNIEADSIWIIGMC